MCGEVAPQQRLVGGDVQQQSHGLHIEPWLQNLQRRLVLEVHTYRRAPGSLDGRTSNHLTIKPPCTPLPLRLGAYSARSTERSHSITLWLVHWEISAGEILFCWKREQKEGGKSYYTAVTMMSGLNRLKRLVKITFR